MLAESIPRPPLLEALNVRQNNLTEKGMLAVVHAVSTCSSLTSVDLSENKLTEPVAERLSQYLRSKSCALEYLILQKCDLDDACACRILEVIDCRTIRHLDFSSNRVGSNETMRSAILGEVYTAGDAFASLLASSTCPLETLKLSWNMIRMQSAASLARSIRNNKSLVHLDLSYNSLGDEAGQILGDALHSHKSLQYLNLTQNNICAKGCFTIVSGIKTCKTLHTVDLSENPIGDFGSRAVMALDVTAGDEVTVLVNGCLLTLRDDKLTFDPSNPIGTYELDLGNPYSRALCIELLRVVADNEHVSIAKAVQTENNTTTELHFSVKKRLKKSRTGREIDMPDEEHIHQIAADIDSAKKLFHRYDEDENGVLDRNEITKMLTDLGLTTSDETVDEMLRFYDFDGRDNIGIGEFSSFLQNVCDAANTAKAWLTEERFIVAGAPGAAAAPPAKGSKYSTLKEYLPPDRGHMHIECVGDQKMPAFLQLASPANVTRIISAMKAVSNGEAMIEHALTSMKLKFEEANKLYRILLKEVGDKVAVLRRLLPRMATYPDAAQLVTAACGGNIRERMHLRRLIGDSFFLLFTGSPNGFYSVNLAEETSKICLKRLIELDAEAAHMRKKRGLGDTSQYANWSGFRNTVLDNTPVILDTEFFDKLPEKGRLEFDFVYMNGVAASEASHAIPDERLFNLLQGLDMVRKDERQYVMTRMKTLREESKAASRGLGVGFQQVDSAAARAIRINLDELHQKVQTRSVDADRTRIDMDTREAPIYADELSSPSRTMKSQTVSRDASRVVSRIVSQTASRVVSRRGTVPTY
jgi:Ran GTPase-activating protein (RanGAP) involved in mRNA processing and transport